jgi:hypothetical protein
MFVLLMYAGTCEVSAAALYSSSVLAGSATAEASTGTSSAYFCFVAFLAAAWILVYPIGWFGFVAYTMLVVLPYRAAGGAG